MANVNFILLSIAHNVLRIWLVAVCEEVSFIPGETGLEDHILIVGKARYIR